MKNLFCFILSFALFTSAFPIIPVFADSPSDWAVSEVNEAVGLGIVPKELQNKYTENITRKEFCKLCVAVMKRWDNDFQYEKGSISFSDTNDEDVLVCAQKGIVSGIGDNKFAPDNPIKRQEAAKMLYNTLNTATPVIFEIHSKTADNALECCIPHSFNDGGYIRSWARNEINHMYRYGVMLGVDDDNYNPDGYYTREQAICTFLRLYRCNGSMKENPIPEADYFPYGETAIDYYKEGHIPNFGNATFDKDTYKAYYIDSRGNKYTQKDKGFVYPFNMEYGIFIWDAPAIGAGDCTLVDKNGNTMLYSNDYISVNGDSILCEEKYPTMWKLYKISDKNEAIENQLVLQTDGGIIYKGDGLYAVYNGDSDSMGVFDINNDAVEKFGPDKYSESHKNNSFIEYSYADYQQERRTADSKSYNNIFVSRNENGDYIIVKNTKPKDEILKQFKVNSSWLYFDSIGSNIKFLNSENQKQIFYRGVSGIYAEYDYVELTENNEAIVRDSDYHYYILNSDGTVKFDAGKSGYRYVDKIEGFDFYKVSKDDGESELCDIVDKNGKIIKTNVDGLSLNVDKSGVFSYRTKENAINFFDFHGDDLGNVRLNDIYGDYLDSTSKFINGMLFVRVYNLENSGMRNDFWEFYVTPQGKILYYN